MKIILISLLALLCEVIGTVGGFGSSVFFVPLAGLIYDLHVVLGLTALLHVSGNLAKMILFRKYINWNVSLLFGIPGIIAVAIGALIVSSTDIVYGEIFLAAFLLLFSVFFFLNREWKAPEGKAYAVAGGGIAGFLAGLIGTGGAVRGAAMTAFNLPKNIFVATSATIDMGVDMTRSIIYIKNGFLNTGHLPIIPLLIVVSFFGSWIGKQVLDGISQESFRKFVLLLIFITGIITLIKAMNLPSNG